jgi:hypothetical protein
MSYRGMPSGLDNSIPRGNANPYFYRIHLSIWTTVGDCGKKAETPGFDGRTREKVGRSKILSDDSAKKKEYLKFQGNDLILKKMSLKF